MVFCGRSEESVERASSELAAQHPGRVFARKCDVSQADDVHLFMRFAEEKLGAIDILVNNAGLGVFAPVEQLTPQDWHRMIDLNLSGVYYCCHEVIPRMKASGGGYIINISSLAGKNPFAGGAGYNASKFGLNGFTEAMMLDHRKDDIRVSYIMPGSVDTQFSHGAPAPSPPAASSARGDTPKSEEPLDRGQAPAVSGWKIAPEDIAEVVVTLVALPQRTLVSRVEIRPLKPPK